MEQQPVVTQPGFQQSLELPDRTPAEPGVTAVRRNDPNDQDLPFGLDSAKGT